MANLSPSRRSFRAPMPRMARYVGLDVSQRITAICAVDDADRRHWCGQSRTVPEEIESATIARRRQTSTAHSVSTPERSKTTMWWM